VIVRHKICIWLQPESFDVGITYTNRSELTSENLYFGKVIMAYQKPANEPQADETTGIGNPELVGQPPHPTPSQAEGDRETVEEDLREKQLD
jgi:hypothetical protein